MIPPRAARGGARALLAIGVAAATTGCLATRSDLQTLQLDIANSRRDLLRADSLRTASLESRLTALDRTLRALSDSVGETSQRASRFEGDAREQLRAVREQLIQVQELTGQSQRRLQDLRASLDARTSEAPPPVAPPAVSRAARPDSESTERAPAPRSGPSASELYRLSTDQLRRGSYGAARTGLTDLLRRYPRLRTGARRAVRAGRGIRGRAQRDGGRLGVR